MARGGIEPPIPRQTKLISNPLHVLKEHFLSTPIIELGGATIGMTGYPLGHLQSAIVF
jgi:hypothetical protein